MTQVVKEKVYDKGCGKDMNNQKEYENFWDDLSSIPLNIRWSFLEKEIIIVLYCMITKYLTDVKIFQLIEPKFLYQ